MHFSSYPPDNDDSWLEALRGVADFHMSMCQWTDAAQALTRYLSFRPGDSACWRNRARCQHIQGNLEGALVDINRALQLKPSSSENLLVRALILIEREEWKLALADLDAAIRAEPENPWARIARASFLIDQERFADAIPDFDAAIERGGQQPEWLKTQWEKERGLALERFLQQKKARETHQFPAAEKTIRAKKSSATWERSNET